MTLSIWLDDKTFGTDFDTLQVNNSSYNKAEYTHNNMTT